MLLLRLTKSETLPTLGVLLHEKVPYALTLERPWLNNVRRISCIPVGTYHCERMVSPKFGETFHVMDVPGRSEILFHRGNIMDDTHGCVIVGEQFGRAAHGEAQVIASRQGFAEFMQILQGKASFTLTIQDANLS